MAENAPAIDPAADLGNRAFTGLLATDARRIWAMRGARSTT